MSREKVRVRFAPSPTGALHIGGVRTALFNYLFAKKNQGDFVLRIEDTDQTRFVEGAEQYIIEALSWCGILPDEGVSKGGAFAPYRQSERKEIYKKYANQLIAQGNAYYAFDTPDELDKMRNRLKEKGLAVPQYDSISRLEMKNSLTLPPDEVQRKIEAGESFVVRFKMPENEEVRMNDIIRGEVLVNTSKLDDKVLFKSDGMPTYHLANIVDDYLMEISHVIRGEEWLPSLPLHVMLYRAFGWEDKMPKFAHLPLLLKPTGKGKLSKRDGDKLGFPVFPLEWTDPKTHEVSSGYRESGYFPEAFINLLAFLGWNPGTEQEIFSLSELVDAFSLERVGKSGARFDPEKAKWYNNHYLQHKSDEQVATLFAAVLNEKQIDAPFDKVKRIVGLVKERVNFVAEIWEQSFYFFETPQTYDPKVVKKRWKENTPQLMSELKDVLASVDVFESARIEQIVKDWIGKNQYSLGAIMNAFRLCIVGKGMGPHLFDIIDVIGKEETIRRLELGILNIKR